MLQYLKNREYRGILIWTIGVSLLFWGLIVLVQASMWQGLKQQLIYRDTALLGAILETDPALEAVVIPYFTRAFDMPLAEKGIEAAARYGWTPALPLSSLNILFQTAYRSYLFHGIAVLVFLVLLIFMIHRVMSSIYERLQQMAMGAEEMMKGNYGITFQETGEGTLPFLAFQYNQLSVRLKMTVAALAAEKEFLKDMLQNLSHQLKTPLSSLIMFHELLLSGSEDKPQIRRELLTKGMQQLERMEWLILTMLKLSRLEAGAVSLAKSSTALNTTILETIRTLEPVCTDKGLNIHYQPRLQVQLCHDPSWLGEALMNILKNAIDYTPAGGKIEVTAEQGESTIEVGVHDTGVGIPPDELPFIFQRFYQGSQTRRLAPKGSGTGLALARLIVEKHGGMIHATSRLGQGTTIRLIFPGS